MKVKKVLLFVFFVSFLQLNVFSQEKTTSYKYSNITEVGTVVNPNNAAIELTTINGVAINSKHIIGLGLGFGNGTYYDGIFCPIFANYRYMLPFTKKIIPHLNVAAGTMLLSNGAGFYSTLGMGFKVGAFTLSGGLSFNIFEAENVGVWDEQGYYGYVDKIVYPVGVMIRLGVHF